MDLGSIWFGSRPSGGAEQLRKAAELGFRGVGLLPGDRSPSLEGVADAARATGLRFAVVSWDALQDAQEPPEAFSPALAGPEAAAQIRARLPGALERLSLLGGRLLIVPGGLDPAPGARERGERVLGRLRAGDRLGAGDEALEELRGLEAGAHERALESLARFLHAVLRAAPGLPVALAPEASPAGLLTPARLALLLSDPALRGVGYWHDTGAVQARASLGLEDPGAWLDQFARIAIGVTLHDYARGRDCLRPGEGEVDWALLGEYLPRAARRVLALAPSYSDAAAREARSALALDSTG